MRSLKLDYRDGGGLRKLFGYLLLSLVLLFAIIIGWYFNHLRLETKHLESMVDRVEGRINGRVTASEVSQIPPAKLAEIIKFSNRAIHQLNLPWDILFTQLEAAKSDGVALLGIEPNAKSNAIKVEGEAKDYAAMIKYVRSLSEQGILQGVYLTEHKMDDQNPDKPVHFTLEASWAAK
jgi:Tfp pilus assembly protein PilN